MQFISIEGARGWLACLVMVNHIAISSNLPEPVTRYLTMIGGLDAVRVFMIISGFVITHLVLERQEPYPAYLVRRFMRLFPLFAATCLAGYLVSLLPFREVAGSGSPFYAETREIAASSSANLGAHVLAHAAMLHGMISHGFLPWSEYAFNAPAWSISLEWQFYLLAPLLLSVRYPMMSLALASLLVVGHFATRGVWVYHQTSMLLDPIGYFAAGIISRLAYRRIKLGSALLPLALIALGSLFLKGPLIVWALIYLGLVARDCGLFSRVTSLLLESTLARHLGARSYSIYLCHYPIMLAFQAAWLHVFDEVAAFPIAMMIVPLTLLVAEASYRAIELPGIGLGSRLTKQLSGKP